MRLTNYELAESIDKKQWLNSINMYVGLPYFGGKSIIGRYILNNIFNLAVQMKINKEEADIFIDAFAGGGKIGLTIPEGWFKTIVLNDLNYGVYSYYKTCKDENKYIDLMYMIEKIGKELMSRDFFHLAAYVRSFGLGVTKWGNEVVQKSEVIDPLVAAALTYWVTSASYNNMTDPETVNYNLTKKDINGKDDKILERDNKQKIIELAYKRIPKLHKKLNKQQYIIENLDYRQLIKKYNGLSYNNILNEDQQANEKYAQKNRIHKLWYFDPPYHPCCLSDGNIAPYVDTFTEALANEMVEILHGDKKDKYGELKYFIKSDYDPANITDDTASVRLAKKLYRELEEYPFCKICVGGFNKGAVLTTGQKSIGMEYIWCRGFAEDYVNIEGEPAKDEKTL